MAKPVKRFFLLFALAPFVLGLAGCASLGLAPVAAAGGAAGVNYSLTNNAYKTMSYSLADVEAALHKSLQKMKIEEKSTDREESKVVISAVAGELDIHVELEKITPTVTRIEVSAKKDLVIKDKATAAEIIVQTEKNIKINK